QRKATEPEELSAAQPVAGSLAVSENANHDGRLMAWAIVVNRSAGTASVNAGNQLKTGMKTALKKS
ncbi:MAG: hypothetical protein EB141_18055, partial [Verrucomicrobia bacterium]|nr:hypothetical protein [Verrucomicrobiota bacterium]